MFKTSLGKLAIGVVALSSVAAAHAESSFVSKLKPIAIGIEGLALGGHGDALQTSNFFHAGPIKNFGATFESGALGRIGSVKIKYSPSFGWLGGERLYSLNPDSEQVTVGKNRTIGAVSGILAQVAAVTFNHDFTPALQGLVRIGGGPVIPANEYKSPYGAIATQVGGYYKFTPSFSVGLGGKYIYTLDNSVKNVSGLEAGCKYHI